MKTLTEALPEIKKHFDFDIEPDGNDPQKLLIWHPAMWGADTEGEYNKQSDFLDQMMLTNELFNLWCWCDISGYDYWMNNMKETNYVSIDIIVKKNLLSERDIQFIISSLEEVDNKIWENMNTEFTFESNSF